MYRRVDTTFVPQITCYEDAVIRFEKARHIRRTNSNERRLCDDGLWSSWDSPSARAKQKKHSLLIKNKCITKPCDGDKDFEGHNSKLITRGEIYYQVRYHDNPIAEFYPDYYQISLAEWNTVSTVAILEALTGAKMVSFRGTDFIPDGYVYHSNDRNGLRTIQSLKTPSKHKIIHTEIPLPNGQHRLPIYSYPVCCATRLIFPKSIVCTRGNMGGIVRSSTRHGVRKSNKKFNTPDTGYLMGSNDWYQFNYDGTPYHTTKFIPFYKYLIDKKELYRVRKNVRDFMNYVEATLKLRSNDGGISIPPEKDFSKRTTRDKSDSQLYNLVYWYCQADKTDEVNEYLKEYDEHVLWGEMLEALVHWNSTHHESKTYINYILVDLDKIIKHANPRTLVRVS